MATPNGLEMSRPAEAGTHPVIVAQAGGPGAPPYPPAHRPKVPGVLPGGSAEGPAKGPALSAGVISQGFSELFGGTRRCQYACRDSAPLSPKGRPEPSDVEKQMLVIRIPRWASRAAL